MTSPQLINNQIQAPTLAHLSPATNATSVEKIQTLLDGTTYFGGLVREVTRNDLIEINKLVESLSPEELNQTISLLSDEELKHWGTEIGDNSLYGMGALTDRDQMRLADTLANHLSDRQYLRISAAFREAPIADHLSNAAQNTRYQRQENQPATVPSNGAATAISLPQKSLNYVIKSGDSLSKIASNFNVSIDDIVRANEITNIDQIKAGDILKIPVPQANKDRAANHPTLEISNPTSSQGIPPQSYIIGAGDTLSQIAKKFGISTAELISANQISNPNLIQVGDKLIIPPSSNAANTETNSTNHTSNWKLPAVTDSPKGITDADWERAAKNLGVDVATIKAVAHVESRGDGFLSDGRPKILFEAHIFSRETGRTYDTSNSDISSSKWDRSLYKGGAEEYSRLEKAMDLDNDAALKSASWGRFQIMGFNYKAAGYDNVRDFVTDMHHSEGKQLDAFVNFIKSNKSMHDALKTQDWSSFARQYNGPAYAQNQYDVKMAEAYAQFKD